MRYQAEIIVHLQQNIGEVSKFDFFVNIRVIKENILQYINFFAENKEIICYNTHL